MPSTIARVVEPAPRRLGLWHRADGAVAWKGGTLWSLPPVAGEGGEEVGRHLSPAGFEQRWDTRIDRAPGAPPGDIEWAAPEAVRERWERGELLVDPAVLAVALAVERPGTAVAAEVTALPLRTATLPPATHTNAYLVGRQAALVVDPGSADPGECDRLVAACQAHSAAHGALAAVFLTHHHGDHTAGAAQVARRLGLPIWAHAATAARLNVTVDRHIEDGAVLGGWTAVWTPGHAAGHLCLWHGERRLLVAGDMVAALGTIVVDPADGDMTEYLASLERLRALGSRVLYPAHGGAILEPEVRLRGYLAHRLWRENRVVAALDGTPTALDAVTAQAYPEVPAAIRWLASRSALAHLIKLERDGRAVRHGEAWARRSPE